MQVGHDFVSHFGGQIEIATADTDKDPTAAPIPKGKILVAGILQGDLFLACVEIGNGNRSVRHKVSKEFLREFQKPDQALDGLVNVETFAPQKPEPDVWIVQITHSPGVWRSSGASTDSNG